ncbi:MAG: NAD(P)-dependent oxidoreductase [Armatimonadetes bacterium]|nr:NAD(P)-dependent oxidoreductase [Armatimonadota bacterium]
MRVALTGSTGYLGSHLCLQLAALGHSIRGLARPASNRSLLDQLSAEVVVGDMVDDASLRALVEDADTVIHNACSWEALRDGPEHNRVVNVDPSLRLLERARQAGVRQYLYVSSISVYGPVVLGRHLDETHPVYPDSLYGMTKAMLEDAAQAYHFVYGLNTSSWRPAAVYGIHPLDPRHATWRDLILDVLTGRPVDTAAGTSTVSAEDTAHAIAMAVGREEVAGQLYNLVDCYVYAQQVAEMAREMSGSEAPIRDRVGLAIPRYLVISDRAQALGARLNRGLEGIREHVRRVLMTV